MPVMTLNLSLDITPKSKLPIPGDGKVIVDIRGSVDVPEPLMAQQIWDAVKEVVDNGKIRLAKTVKKGDKAGWSEADLEQAISNILTRIDQKAAKAVSKTIKAVAVMDETYTIVKRQDYGMAAKSSTQIALSITKLVISGGADISSWGSLVKTLVKSAKYLHKAMIDINKQSSKTKKSLKKAESYYRGKVLTGKENTWDKFCKMFKDPLKDANASTKDLQKRLARAEKPCHEMAAVIQELLEKQDLGQSNPKIEAQLNKLLISVSDTMEKVTKANRTLSKANAALKDLENDLKAFKDEKGKSPKQILGPKMTQITQKAQEMKKFADDRAISDWAAAANNTYKLANELAALL